MVGNQQTSIYNRLFGVPSVFHSAHSSCHSFENFTPISWGDDPQFWLAHSFQFWAVQPKIGFLGSSIFHSFFEGSQPAILRESLNGLGTTSRISSIPCWAVIPPNVRGPWNEILRWLGWRAELDSVGKLWKVSGNPKSLTIWRIHRNDKISCDGHCFLGHVNCVCVCFLLVFFCHFFFFASLLFLLRESSRVFFSEIRGIYISKR